MRRGLQVAVAVFGLVPVGAGLAGIILGGHMVGRAPVTIDLDSHVRYLSGLLLAIGIAYWAAIPSIERQRERFVLLTALVFLGGLGRLGGIVMHGWPSASMCGGLVMELVVTPGLLVWQRSLKH